MVELFAPLRGLNIDFESDRGKDTGRHVNLCKGIAELPASRKQTALQDWLDHEVRSWFAKRILPVTEPIAERWGRLAAAKQKGMTLAVVDGVIAATSLHHDLTIVTRNVKDFARLGVAIFNPWDDAIRNLSDFPLQPL